MLLPLSVSIFFLHYMTFYHLKSLSPSLYHFTFSHQCFSTFKACCSSSNMIHLVFLLPSECFFFIKWIMPSPFWFLFSLSPMTRQTLPASGTEVQGEGRKKIPVLHGGWKEMMTPAWRVEEQRKRMMKNNLLHRVSFIHEYHRLSWFFVHISGDTGSLVNVLYRLNSSLQPGHNKYTCTCT